jgi:hypothetical protein
MLPLVLLLTTASVPAPTVFLHGVNGAASDFNTIIAWMHEVTALSVCCGLGLATVRFVCSALETKL